LGALDARNFGVLIRSEHIDDNISDAETLVRSAHARSKDAQLSAANDQRRKDPCPRPQTTRLEAYDLQLRGKALHIKVQQESSGIAREMFQKAIALDPNYAKAYAALAGTWIRHAAYLAATCRSPPHPSHAPAASSPRRWFAAFCA
jgi:hypothetical protein